jgi:hypothetical protein
MGEMPDCPRCGYHLAELTPHCPGCGTDLQGTNRHSATPVAFTDSGNFLQRFPRMLWEIHTQPTAYFKRMPISGGAAEPLAFALICHWIGAGFRFLWIWMSGDAIQGYLTQLSKLGDQFKDIDSGGRYAQWTETGKSLTTWFLSAGSVLADPFLTLAMLLFTTFFIWLGARLLVTPGKDGAPKEIAFETALRINCYGFAPAILTGLPFLGGLISWIYIWIVTIIAAKNVYKVSTTRATIVALFTQVVFTGIMCVGMLVGIFALMRLLSHT